MKVIESLDDLTVEELDRIYETLIERFGVGQRGNICDIGFGIAEDDGTVNQRRRDEVVFYVTKKCTPRAKRDRIPKPLEVRLKRANRFVLVRLPTDVVVLENTSDLVLTGREIKHLSRAPVATASAILVWRVAGEYYFRWGVISVGHLFWSRRTIPETAPQVAVQIDGEQLTGRLLMRTRPNDGVDIALAEIELDELKRSLGFRPRTAAKPIRSINDLKDDRGKRGTTKPRDSELEFRVLRYFPQFRSVPDIGTLFHILTVESGTSGAFKVGRSGSQWNIARQFACHQIFGWEAGNFRRAGGQSMHYALRWVQAELAKFHSVTKSSMTIRIVHYL